MRDDQSSSIFGEHLWQQDSSRVQTHRISDFTEPVGYSRALIAIFPFQQGAPVPRVFEDHGDGIHFNSGLLPEWRDGDFYESEIWQNRCGAIHPCREGAHLQTGFQGQKKGVEGAAGGNGKLQRVRGRWRAEQACQGQHAEQARLF